MWRTEYMAFHWGKEGQVGELSDSDVTYRIRVGLAKWMQASGVWDKRVTIKLKGKFCSAVMRLALRESGTEDTDRRILRFMNEVFRMDRIRDKHIRGHLGMTNVTDKIREPRLRWFGHVRRRDGEDQVRVILGLRLEGRTKVMWEQVVTTDVAVFRIAGNLVGNRRTWKAAIDRLDRANGGMRVCVLLLLLLVLYAAYSSNRVCYPDVQMIIAFSGNFNCFSSVYLRLRIKNN